MTAGVITKNGDRMQKPTYQPKHYNALTITVNDAAPLLDVHHDQGWRVFAMALHADGERVTFLLEKSGSKNYV